MTMPSSSRGLNKPTLTPTPSGGPRCAAMAVGSVPHHDPQDAVDLVMRFTPEIPTWPQLPRRAFHENMYVQFTEGFPGIRVDQHRERVYVLDELPIDELTAFFEAMESDDPSRFAISPEYAATIPLLKHALSEARPPFVKGQVTGPVSFGLGLPREDRRALLYDDTMRDVAVQLIVMKARWQLSLLATWAPLSTPLIMVDEPSLTQMGSAFVSIPENLAFPALERCLRALPCLAGIHVCGATDWSMIASLPVDVLNFDAADHLDSFLAHGEAVGAFLREGGLLAWGVIPNDDRAYDQTAEETGARVMRGAETLASAGPTAGALDVGDILEASFVSPACGTGALRPELAERCFALTAETSSWLRARI
ncbi:MAG: uroporphyrinogen decarboxylase/cobalamine-independent methonine synthase family protein [Thermoleophilia bacterium]